METEVKNIPAPVCEAESDPIEATNNSIKMVPQEEKTPADASKGPSTAEGNDFLNKLSADEVHPEVNNISPNASMATEKANRTVKDENEIFMVRDPKLGEPLDVASDEGASSKTIQENTEESNDSQIGRDKELKNESEKLQLSEVSIKWAATDKAKEDVELNKRLPPTEALTESAPIYKAKDEDDELNQKLPRTEASTESEAIDKAKDEDEELNRVELLEDEKNTINLLKQQTDESVESLQVIPNNLKAPHLSQDKEKKSSEEQMLNVSLDGVTSGVTEEKSIDVTETQKEVLEKMELIEATNNSTNTLPQEEKTLVDEQPRRPTTEGNYFLETTSADEVHAEVNYISPNASMGSEKPNQTVKDETEILHARDPKLDDHPLDIAANEENCSKTIQENTEESNDSRIGGNTKLENGSEKLPLTEAPTESAANDKAKDEDEELNRVELFENEKNTISLLKQEKDESVETVHVVTGNLKASHLSQDKEKTSSEEQMQNVSLEGITRGVTVEKNIDAVETQKEILESMSTIMSCSSEEGNPDAVLQGTTSYGTVEKTIDKVDLQKEAVEVQNFSTTGLNEATEEQHLIEADVSEAKFEESPEKDGEKVNQPQSLIRGATDDESVVIHEARIMDGELREYEMDENEKYTETDFLEKESKIEKPEDPLNADSIENKKFDLSIVREISSFEEQNAATRVIADGETDEISIDAAEKNDKILQLQEDRTFASNEKTEDNSLIQKQDSENKDEENLEKDNHTPSSINNSVHKVETVSSEGQSATASSQIIQDQKTEETSIDPAEVKEETPVVQNVSTIASNEKTEENLLIQVDGHQKKDDEHLEDNVKPSLLQDSIVNPSDNALAVTDEVKLDINGAESLQEKIKESDFLKEELDTGKPSESFSAVVEYTKATDSGHDKEKTDFLENQSPIINPHRTLDETTEEETADPCDSKDKTEEQQDISDMKHDLDLAKVLQEQSLVEASSKDTNEGKSTTTHDTVLVDEHTKEVGFSDDDKTADSTLVTKENLQDAPEDHKPSPSSEDIEAPCSLEEQSVTANPQSVINEKGIDVTDTNEENLENVEMSVSNEDKERNFHIQYDDSDKNSSIQLDTSDMKHKLDLVKDLQEPSLIETSSKDTNEGESTTKHAVLVDKHTREVGFSDGDKTTDGTLVTKENLQDALEDHKPSPSREDIEETCSLDEQNVTANPQSVINEERIDVIDTNEANLENVAISVSNEDSESKSLIQYDDSDKSSSIQLDASDMKQDLDLVKDLQEPSVIEASSKDANEGESATTHEPILVNEHTREVGFSDGEKITDSNLVTKENLQDAPEDHISPSSEDIEATCSFDEQSVTANPQSVINEKRLDAIDTNEENLKNGATKFPQEYAEETLVIQPDGSRKEHDEQLGKESKTSFFTEALTEENNDSKSTLSKLEERNEDSIEVESWKKERNIVSASVKEGHVEKLIDLYEVAHDDIQASDSTQDTKTSHDKEEIQTPDLQEISSGRNDEKADDTTESNILDFQDIVRNNLDGGNEDESPLKGDGTQKEVLTAKGDDDVPTDTHEKNGGASVKEVTHIVSLQVETDDKASASVKEEQVPPADPQEIFCDKSEEKTIGGPYEQEKVVEDIVKNVSGGENEDNSPVEVDELHEPSPRNDSTGNNIDVEPPILAEAKFEDDNSTKVNLTDNERCAEGILVAETTQESEIRSQEAQSLITDFQEITSHHKVEKTIDATGLEEGNLEDENTATTTPSEEAQEKSLIQTDCSQIESTEQLVNESANPPFTEAQKAHTTENALWKEEPEMEKPMDSVHVLSENTKAPTSTQDTETSFIEQQDMAVDPHEISGGKLSNDKTNGKGEIQEVQDIATNVLEFDKEESSATKPNESEQTTFAEDFMGNITEDTEANIPSSDNEDHSPIRVDGSQEPCLAEGFTGNVAHHESRLVSEGSLIAGIVENEKITHDALIKEETTDESLQVTEEIEASASGKDREPISQADQTLVEKTVDNRVEVITGATDLNEDNSKEMASKSLAVEIPRSQVSDVYKDTVVDFTEGHNCNQEESLGLNASDEHVQISNELVTNVTSSKSEPSVQDSTKIDAQKKTVAEGGPTKVPENGGLVKSDPTESSITDARVQDEETKAELKQDTESRNNKDVSESNNLNDGEDRKISDNIKHKSDSSKSVALEEVPSSNVSSNSVALEEVLSSDVVSEKDSAPKPSLNPIEETWLEAVNEEAQKQDEELHVSALAQDSAMEKLEHDEKPCPASVTDSVIPQEIQKLEEESLPATDKKPTENKDLQESEITQDQTNQKDEKLGEREQEKAKYNDEKVLSVETAVETKEPERASVSLANDLLPKYIMVSSELDHPMSEAQMTTNKEDVLTGKTPTCDFEETEFEKNKEQEANKQIISEFSSAALNIRDTSDGDGADRSTSDAEAPKIVQTATGANENQEVENTSVAQTSASISSYERDNNEHGHSGIEEKPDANELGFALEESKTEHEVKKQVLDTIDQVQSLEAATAAPEIVSESAIVEDKTESKETVEVNIPSQKINDNDDDVEDDHCGFCKADITERHLKDQVKPEENTETQELSEVIKNPSTTEKVSTFPEEAADKVLEDLEEIQEIHAKDEVSPIYSANKGEQESTRTETWTKPTEDERENTYVEAEKVGISSHTEDTTEVLPSDAAEGVPEENKNNTTKNKYSQEKCAVEEPTGAELTGHLEAKVSGEGHAAEANQKGPVSETLKQEIDEQQVEMNSESITKRTKVNSQENIADYDCENISESNVQQSSVEDTAQSDETQETERSMASPLTLPAVECSNSEIKDLPMGFKGTDVTELKVPTVCEEAIDKVVEELGELPARYEINPMQSANKIEEEGTRAETWTILTEDEDKNTYVEMEKVGFSSHTKDTIEVSSSDAAQLVPEDNENSTTMNKYSPEKCENVEPTGTELTGHLEAKGSSDGQEAEANRKGPMSVTLQEERDEQQLERTSEPVTRAEEVNSQEEKITDYESPDISVSDVKQSSVEDTAQTDKLQQTKGQVASLPISSDVKCSNTEITEKDLPMGFEGTGETELKETPIPSDDKHIVSEEDHTRNTNPEKSVGDNNITAVTRGNAEECSQDEHKLLKNKNNDEPSQSDLLQEYPKEASQTQPAHEKETATHNEDPGAEKADETEHEERKPDGEKGDEEESNKAEQIELCSEAPVMVDAGDADVKVAHKKSHNILSGVGSKVKHSIAKVKKAITGKSTHPKPSSPK